MTDNSRKKKALVILLVTAVVVFGLFELFGLFGKAVDIHDIRSSAEMLLAIVPIPIGLWWGLYYCAGSKVAYQIGGATALALMFAVLVAVAETMK